MKKLFIIGNWKSNKNAQEAHDWIKAFKDYRLETTEKTIILCAPFTLLANLHTWVVNEKVNIEIGAQDVSPFDAGAYTGEVNARQIKEFADYTIIGHSERRNNLFENDELLTKKTKSALLAGLTPVYCIQDENTFIPQEVTLVAYEPPTAIGSGNPDTPENAEKVARMVMQKNPQVTTLLYGGSVSPDNIHSFVQMEHISGVLAGGASLDVNKFAELIKNA